MTAMRLASPIDAINSLRAVEVAAAFRAGQPLLVVFATDQAVAAVELRAAVADRYFSAGFTERHAGQYTFASITDLAWATIPIVTADVIWDAFAVTALESLVAMMVITTFGAEGAAKRIFAFLVMAAEQSIAAVELQLAGDRGPIQNETAFITEVPAACFVLDAVALIANLALAAVFVYAAFVTGAIIATMLARAIFLSRSLQHRFRSMQVPKQHFSVPRFHSRSPGKRRYPLCSKLPLMCIVNPGSSFRRRNRYSHPGSIRRCN